MLVYWLGFFRFYKSDACAGFSFPNFENWPSVEGRLTLKVIFFRSVALNLFSSTQFLGWTPVWTSFGSSIERESDPPKYVTVEICVTRHLFMVWIARQYYYFIKPGLMSMLKAVFNLTANIWLMYETLNRIFQKKKPLFIRAWSPFRFCTQDFACWPYILGHGGYKKICLKYFCNRSAHKIIYIYIEIIMIKNKWPACKIPSENLLCELNFRLLCLKVDFRSKLKHKLASLLHIAYLFLCYDNS